MWVIRVSMKPGEKNVQARAERPLIRLKACGESHAVPNTPELRGALPSREDFSPVLKGQVGSEMSPFLREDPLPPLSPRRPLRRETELSLFLPWALVCGRPLVPVTPPTESGLMICEPSTSDIRCV